VARNRTINIAPAERAARVVVGAAATVVGVWLLVTADAGWLATTGAALLALAGLDLVITGALGYCPLYARLGYIPPRLRAPAVSPVRPGREGGKR
jgi:hypothetical protein